MKLLHVVVGFFMAVSVGAASARTPVPIVNFDNVTFATVSGKKPDLTQIQQAVIRAAMQHQWTTTPTGDNKLIATLDVRGKHSVAVDISWTADTYTIRYRSSVNMSFAEDSKGAGPQAGPVIHPFYNKWVGNLRDGINRELAQL
jgi:hypothetical protein